MSPSRPGQHTSGIPTLSSRRARFSSPPSSLRGLLSILEGGHWRGPKTGPNQIGHQKLYSTIFHLFQHPNRIFVSATPK